MLSGGAGIVLPLQGVAPDTSPNDHQGERIRGNAADPLVSITDHDDLEVDFIPRVLGKAPPSQVLHIGVHNLPPDRARAFEAEMARYRPRPSQAPGKRMGWTGRRRA